MYLDIYPFEVIEKICAGYIVNCTDRQKGETLYVNGMNVHEYAELLMLAEKDKTNRFKFFIYDKTGEKDGEKDA